MKRPSFQFYPGDWRNNAKLRRCSEGARGVWMDILCVLHDSDEYGVCRWPLADLARAAGAPLKLVKELVAKEVLKGADKGAAPYVYTPRHAGKDGDPVTLVEPCDGPCWYCSRFVRDEWVRSRRGSSSHFTTDNQPPKSTPKGAPDGTPNPSPDTSPNTAPKPSPKGGIGERQGDGPSSSSSSSTSLKSIDTPRVEAAQPAAEAVALAPLQGPEEVELFGHPPPEHAHSQADDCPHQAIIALYHEHLPISKRIRSWNGTRPTNLRARWREDRKRQNLAWWEGLFRHIAANCRFLWDKPWFGLDWLVKLENFNKAIEGNYDDREERAA